MKIYKLAIVVLFLQFLFLTVSYIANIFIIEQVTGFIYLTFIPGFLVFCILSNSRINVAKYITFIIGLSLCFIMFTGVALDVFLRTLGVCKPISKIYLTVCISVFNFILFALCYYLGKFKLPYLSINISSRQIQYILLFSVLPFISIFGAYILNYYNNNVTLVVLYIVLALIPIFIAFNEIPNTLYPFVIWTTSISLLFSVTLSVKYLSGHLSDATLEYYFAKLVKLNGFWNLSIARNKNSMLGITMLLPIYSILLNLNLTNIFKIVYPILYSFTPVSLYIAFSKYFSKKTSFYACFFLMSFYVYYVVLSRNTRTGLAEFFLSLFILSIVDNPLPTSKGRIFVILFALAIVVTHYGTAYITLIVFIFSYIVHSILKYFYKHKNCIKYKLFTLNLSYIVLYSVFAIFWYIYTSISVVYKTLIRFFMRLLSNISRVLTPTTSYAVYAISRKWVLSIEISRDLLILATIFMTIGVVRLIRYLLCCQQNTWKKTPTKSTFAILSITFYSVLLFSFFFGKRFNPARIYHISLCFLSPFIVVGFLELFNLTSKKLNKNYLKIFAVFLMIFLLFNSGVISELIKNGDYSPNIILSKPRSVNIKNVQYLKSFYSTYLFDREVFSARWLYHVKSNSINIKIYMANPGSGIFFGLMGPGDIAKCYIYVDSSSYIKRGYIYLTTLNVKRGIAIVNLYPPKIEKIDSIYPLNLCNRIYTNGGSEIYSTKNV